jgi:hypothetical protein
VKVIMGIGRSHRLGLLYGNIMEADPPFGEVIYIHKKRGLNQSPFKHY